MKYMSSGTMVQSTPSLEEAYTNLKPMFFAALGSLARQGFVASPADSMDLVHDFFADNWSSLERNFDPAKGTFGSYAYGAFVQFARPRIVRLHRWQNSLIGEEEMDAFPAKEERSLSSVDVERVRKAVRRLPIGVQEILLCYVDSDYTSERSLAKELGVSRYRVREILVDALGQLVASFDRPPQISPQDWSVVLALWGERRTVEEAATVLQQTPQQVRMAHRRNVMYLSEALKQYQPQTWSPQRRKKMAAKPQPSLPLALLEKALASPQNVDLLAEVRVNADVILKELEKIGSPMSAADLSKLPPDWVAEVYETIFFGAETELQQDVARAQNVEAHRGEDTKIGEAFRDVLLTDLSEQLRYPPEIRALSKISTKEFARLERTPDVVAGCPVSLDWLAHGVRPLTVFYATKSIAGQLERYLHRGYLVDPIVLGDESLMVEINGARQPLSLLLRQEISRRAECRIEITDAIYSWLVRVASYKTWLFAGFEARPQPGGETVRLNRNEESTEETYARWGLASMARRVPSALASASS